MPNAVPPVCNLSLVHSKPFNSHVSESPGFQAQFWDKPLGSPMIPSRNVVAETSRIYYVREGPLSLFTIVGSFLTLRQNSPWVVIGYSLGTFVEAIKDIIGIDKAVELLRQINLQRTHAWHCRMYIQES